MMNIDNPSCDSHKLIVGDSFCFHCHSGVSCFLFCCHNVNLLLFPYDLILMKQALGLTSSELLEQHVEICEGSHPFFPGLRMRMLPDDDQSCPFLEEKGCRIYKNRPSACRTYPLERGVEFTGIGGGLKSHYFMTDHSYCKGHSEPRRYTIRQWEREQQLYECNIYNDLWAELDAFFSTNPWAGEGKAGPKQQLAFMVCYDIDGFRLFAEHHNLLKQFKLPKDQRRRIAQDDTALLSFGFSWLEFVLGGRKRLTPI